MKRRRKDKRQRRGAVLVEAAIVLPLVLLFFFGIFEYGRYLMTLHLCNNAARAGAAYAARHGTPIVLEGTAYGNATSDVINVVNSCLPGQLLDGQSILVYLSDSRGNNSGNWTDAQAGQYVCVEISGTHRFMVPQLLFLPTSVAASFKAVKRSEGN